MNVGPEIITPCKEDNSISNVPSAKGAAAQAKDGQE
jgi:hypothetical protein